MNYTYLLFLLLNWCTGPAGHTTCCKYPCELIIDTVYYDNEKIHEIKYYANDTGCLNTYRSEIHVIVIDEDCWDCGDIVEDSLAEKFELVPPDHDSVNYFTFSYSVIKERHPFSYLWYGNGFPKRNYTFYSEAEQFKMRELEYDSLQNITKEGIYYYVKDSVFDEEDGITFTGWFREN